MDKAKKFPVSISYKDYRTKNKEFLVPNPENSEELIGIKTGGIHKYGMIAYIGVQISIMDVIDKMNNNGIEIGNVNEYKFILEKYIDEIYKYKISNIIEGGLDENNNIILNKVANRPEK